MLKNYSNNQADSFYKTLLTDYTKIPFAFTYDCKEYIGFNQDFKLLDKTIINDQTTETAILKFGLKNLEIKVKLKHYFTHGATDFTFYFENNSTTNTKVIENPHFRYEFTQEKPLLKGIYGDHHNYYMPYCHDFKEPEIEFKQTTGKATEIFFPYFNLEHENGGTMLAIGWGGTWCANFTKTQNGVLYKGNSVNDFKAYLKPGEKIRTALFVMANYSVRNEDYATNYWRDWFLKYNTPKASLKGDDIEPFTTVYFADDTGKVNSDGSISEGYDTWKPTYDVIIKEKIDADYRWVDAGWYVRPDGDSAKPFVDGYEWWNSVGTWELDPAKWPDNSFKESVEYGHKHGIKTFLWFEPERTNDVSNMVKNHGYKKEWAIDPADMPGLKHLGNHFYYGADCYHDPVTDKEVKGTLNNLGIEECRKYTTERICKLLRENNIDFYREDRNGTEPATLWHHRDLNVEGKNRFGITESKAVDGHYKMWDDIIKCTSSYGGASFVDNCSSGGSRLDIESMRRSIPVMRSDFDRTTIGVRLSISSTFNKWIPFHGSSTRESEGEHSPSKPLDQYIWRASYLPILNIASKFAHHPDGNFEPLHKGTKEWRKINKYLLKDFYVLTDWHHRFNEKEFTAFCYFDPEEEKGIILAFRQDKCEKENLTVNLSFLEDNAEYILTDEDTKETYTLNGKELSLYFKNPRSEKLIWIKKK